MELGNLNVQQLSERLEELNMKQVFGKEEKESVIFVLHFLFCIIYISMSLLFFFLASLGLHCCMQAFFSCSQRGLLLQLWCAGLVATQNVGSSWTKDQTLVSCTGR